jgi:hypothetical protein
VSFKSWNEAQTLIELQSCSSMISSLAIISVWRHCPLRSIVLESLHTSPSLT